MADDFVNFYWIGKRSPIVRETTSIVTQRSREVAFDVPHSGKRKTLFGEEIILLRYIMLAILKKIRSQRRRSLLRCEYPRNCLFIFPAVSWFLLS